MPDVGFLTFGAVAAAIVVVLYFYCRKLNRRRRCLRQKLYIVEYPSIGSKMSCLSADDLEFYQAVAASARPQLPFTWREMTPSEKEAAYVD